MINVYTSRKLLGSKAIIDEVDDFFQRTSKLKAV